MKTCLITGGGSKFGAHLTAQLIAHDYHVYLVTGNPDEQGQYNAKTENLPGLLFTLDNKNQVVPSRAHAGLQGIWQAIYQYKMGLAQQLEPQVKGLEQRSAGAPEGEGFVTQTPFGPIKIVNRGVFSAANAAKNA